MAFVPLPPSVQTPQIKTQSLPQPSPSQTSPARSTPSSATKNTVVKALPTVRDHTTDQLGPEGDEYIPREIDPEGEQKIDKNGDPLSGRKYRCRTFNVPNRGEKLFMLATECARNLGYRDSYLLFNKNRSLFKIIANQTEKDDLIHQDILAYSYRSRQIAIVTARSMFRQFGSRLIENGRRVRDDYWEAKARKQGFTEEDQAGEKRPGAAKAREAAAAEASHAALTSLPQGEVIYSNGPGIDGPPPRMGQTSLAPLPMIHLPSDDIRAGGYGNVLQRPRQEMTGAPPYQDRTQSSNPNDVFNQAKQAAEFNQQLSQARQYRSKYLDDIWRRPHEQPTTQAQDSDSNTVPQQHLQSPQAVAGVGQGRAQPDHVSHPGSQMIQGYGAYPNQQNPMQSPVQPMHRPMSSNPMLPNTPMTAGHRQAPSYGGYPPNQMWQAQQPQPSPLSQQHHMAQYGQQQHHQSPMPPPQMHQQAGMGYPMGQMGNAMYGMSRNMYQANPQQFNMQSAAGQQPGMQGWSTPGSAGGVPQDWQRYQ